MTERPRRKSRNTPASISTRAPRGHALVVEAVVAVEGHGSGHGPGGVVHDGDEGGGDAVADLGEEGLALVHGLLAMPLHAVPEHLVHEDGGRHVLEDHRAHVGLHHRGRAQRIQPADQEFGRAGQGVEREVHRDLPEEEIAGQPEDHAVVGLGFRVQADLPQDFPVGEGGAFRRDQQLVHAAEMEFDLAGVEMGAVGEHAGWPS